MLKNIIIILSIIFITSGCTTNNYTTKEQIVVKNSDKFNLRKMLKKAQAGDIEAQANLGKMYCFGINVQKNYIKAVKWWKIAAENGHANAQYNLGVSYKLGTGLPIDLEKSIFWFKKAAAADHTLAQYNLGGIYMQQKDYEKAIPLIKKAADKGDNSALDLLAQYHFIVEKNKTKAIELFEKAATNGNANSCAFLTDFYLSEKKYDKALTWAEKAAINQNPDGFTYMALIYLKGLGVPKNEAKGNFYMQKAIDNKSPLALRAANKTLNK